MHRSTGEYVFGANTFLDKAKINERQHRVTYTINPSLGSGSYFIKVAIFGEDDSEILEYIDKGPSFEVENPKQNWEGIINLDRTWE